MHSELSLEVGAVFGLDKQGVVRRLTVNQDMVGIRFEQIIQGNCWISDRGVYHISKPNGPSRNPRNVFTGLTHGFKNSSKEYEVFAGGESERLTCCDNLATCGRMFY